MDSTKHMPSRLQPCFKGMTDGVVLRRLEHETDHLLLCGLFVAVAVHVMIASVWTTYRPEAGIVRPMAVELRIIPPRMVKPFHVSGPRRTRQKRRHIGPRGPSTLPGADYTAPDSPVLDDMYPMLDDTLLVDYERQMALYSTAAYRFENEIFLPAPSMFSDRISRYSDKVFSLKEELVTLDDLDGALSDRFKGLVITNPNDKNALAGYIYLPYVYVMSTAHAGRINMSGGLLHLAEAVSKYTGIKGHTDHALTLSPGLEINAPFLYIGADDTWEYFPCDVTAVRDYLNDGGFVMFENRTPWLINSAAELSLRQFITDMFGSSARLEIIPNSHPIYHILFDFDDGPPLGAELAGADKAGDIRINYVPYLEGLFLDGRLAAIFSNKGYGLSGDFGGKMTVNIVLYAMTQWGGKTVRLTDYDLDPDINMIRSTFQPIHKEGNLVQDRR